MEYNSVQSRHVFGILQLLDDYEACYITGHSMPRDAQEYLTSLSAQGDDVSGFDTVSRYQPSSRLLYKLSKNERLQLANQFIQAKDWDKFSMMQELMPRHKLPYKTIHSNISTGELWALLTKQSQVDPFIKFFAHHSLAAQTAVGSKERLEVLQSLLQLHLRATPKNLSEDQLAQYQLSNSLAELSKLWYTSVFESFQYHKSSHFDNWLFESGAGDSQDRLQSRAQYAQQVLTLAMRAYEEIVPHVAADAALSPIWDLLQCIPYGNLVKSKVDAAQALAHDACHIVCHTVIPILEGIIQFDPAIESTYVNQTSCDFFDNKMFAIAQLYGSCKEVTQSIAAVILNMHERATQSLGGTSFAVKQVNEEDSLSTKKKQKFVYFNSALHDRVARSCRRIARQLLREMHADWASQYQEVAKQLWLLQRMDYSADDVIAYLSQCASYLPGTLLAEEFPVMVKRARETVLSTYEENPDRWKKELVAIATKLKDLGLLERVLDHENIPERVQYVLLVEHAGFGNDKARQALKEATFAADGECRAKALINWLEEACKTDSLASVEEALTFAATRLKNESGMHRKTVFEWLGEHFVTNMVMKSLLEKDDESSYDLVVHEAMCKAISSIQANDLGRLDCISQNVCFPDLPASIIANVLAFDPTQPCLRRRYLWIDCAIRMHWDLQSAAFGEQWQPCFTWPLNEPEPEPLESTSWVSLEAFQSVYPPGTSSTQLADLRRSMNLEMVVRKEFDAKNVFGPLQCVDILSRAIKAVWSDDLPVAPFLEKGFFPEDDAFAAALGFRMETLFRLCGPTWQEVELLSDIFDNMFNNLETAPLHHCYQASTFLDVLLDIHTRTVAAQVPRLVDACDRIFRRFVFSNDSTYVERWLPQWQAMYRECDSHVWDVPVDDRMKHFVYLHSKGCKPKVWRHIMSKTDRINRDCCMARELLTMSSSALLWPSVREVIFQRRQDVLLRYVQEGIDLQGVFCTESDKYSSVGDLLFQTCDDHTLLSCHSAVSHHYAQFALMVATSSRTDLKSRIDAIAKFMNAPSTQHLDVLTALQSDLDDAVREALINGVFSLDSPWHILGFLFSQKVMEKNDQRITAALLGYVARHVHVDKVVQVMKLLLRNPRRNKLTFQLHKGVVRMLFDAATDAANQLLCNEFKKDIPDGVRSLMVERCMQRVVAGRKDGWETDILSQVAKDKSMDVELKFCLLSPQWTGTNVGSIDIEKAEDVATDELLDLYRRKRPPQISVSSSSVMHKLRFILEELENSSEGTLQSLARTKKLSLSNIFSCSPPEDDQDALGEMLQFLASQPTESVDHLIQVEMKLMASWFATATFNVMRSQLGDLRGAGQQEISEKCEKLDASAQFKACVDKLLNAALDLPIRMQLQRSVLLNALSTLLITAKRADVNLFHVHIKPFAHKIDVLESDAVLVQSALDHRPLYY